MGIVGIDGAFLFKLKDTHGIPFSISFDWLMDRNLSIDIRGIINEARSHDWWDFQLLPQIEEALIDIQHPEKDFIIGLFKNYCVKYPHPGLINESAY